MTATFYPQQVDYILKLNELWDRGTASLYGTSTSTVSLTLGSKSLTTQPNLQFTVGSQISLTSVADLTKYMSGQVTSYNSTTGALVLNVIAVHGSGSYSNWSLALSGGADAISAIEAANSAAAAATSESNAASSASAASTSASSAATSATSASASAASATASASTATTQAGNASTSASNASTSATNAANSATTAATQATNANTSAVAAGNSATTASTQATNAATSASNAATSATNAGNSATAAASSAGAASISATNAAIAEANAAVNASAATLADYTALRAYSGASTALRVSGYTASGAPLGINGLFTVDITDTTSADNGGTIIVSSSGKRWKRVYDGAVNILWFGVLGDGTTNNSTAIQAVFNSTLTQIYFPKGVYKISTGLTFTSGISIEFEQGASLLAGTASMTMLSAPVAAYGSQLINLTLDGNSLATVTGLSVQNMRLRGACISNISLKGGLTNGMILEGCFGLLVSNPASYNNVNNPIILTDNCSGIMIECPQLDNTANDTGTGIYVNHTTYGNLGVVIDGGYIQGFNIGVLDTHYGTKIRNTYFEQNITADVSSTNARGFIYEGTQHFASTGAVGFLARNCDGGSILQPLMASGARTKGLFDFDATCTNCYYMNAASAYSMNSVNLTYAIGISQYAKESSGTFTPVVEGTSTAGTATYSVQTGTWRKIGQRVFVELSVTYTGHTGTGNTIITGVPTNLSFAFSGDGALVLSGTAFTGIIMYSRFNGTSSNISLRQVTAAGADSLIGIPAAATINIRIEMNSNRYSF